MRSPVLADLRELKHPTAAPTFKLYLRLTHAQSSPHPLQEGTKLKVKGTRSDFSGVLVRGAHIQGRQKPGGQLVSPTSHRTMQFMGHRGAGPPMSRGVRPPVQGVTHGGCEGRASTQCHRKARHCTGRQRAGAPPKHGASTQPGDPHMTQRGTSVGQGTIPVGVKHTPGAKPL